MPVWLQALLAAAGTATAGAAAFFAWHQAWTNRLTLQHELFERRFEVFRAVQAYLSFIMSHGAMKMDEESRTRIGAMLNAWQKSRFLFDKELSDYLEQIYQRSIKLMVYGEENTPKPNWETDITWIMAQTTAIFERFRPYLAVDVIAGKRK